jgi:hypothetical protein
MYLGLYDSRFQSQSAHEVWRREGGAVRHDLAVQFGRTAREYQDAVGYSQMNPLDDIAGLRGAEGRSPPRTPGSRSG